MCLLQAISVSKPSLKIQAYCIWRKKQANNKKNFAQKVLSQDSFKKQIPQQYLKGHVCSTDNPLGIYPSY